MCVVSVAMRVIHKHHRTALQHQLSTYDNSQSINHAPSTIAAASPDGGDDPTGGFGESGEGCFREMTCRCCRVDCPSGLAPHAIQSLFTTRTPNYDCFFLLYTPPTPHTSL